MKYQVGDLLLIKHCEYKLRPRLRPRPVILPYFRLYYRREMFNSFGIVTEAIKHSDAWEGETTSDENVYIWFSQIDGKEYYFCEDEIAGEVV
jgi:hypothetical protein